ncbi:MAG: argininosuccinate lyase [Clostridiales bacterium]|nr:argininosuccinate lyase [Clostridiales bacterium]MBQ3322595.1 argininosuccinate lyase [Bacillota bacterium]
MKQTAKEFMSSINVDNMLYDEEVIASRAHARMLKQNKLISAEECDQLIKGLDEVLADVEAGKVEFKVAYDDIHGCIEQLLEEKIGPVARKLNWGRSVNDQVVIDTRLFLRAENESIMGSLRELMDTLETLAKEHVNTIMPGYSHLQRAQPITLAYHMLAYYQMFRRDLKRFEHCMESINVMPPDCGALAGNVFDTDRKKMAKELGFDGILPNAMDAVADRDFGMEFINDCSITMMHLSRFCEDLILWSSVEFGFIEIDDEFTTGSRVLPQKKNLDVAELIRGKTGRVYGDMINLLTVFKGLPMSYNRDMQEDKYAMLDAAHTVEACLTLFVEMIKSMKINRGEMQRAAKYGYMNATELAEYLMEKGVETEKIGDIISKVVQYAINHNKPIEELWLDDLKQFTQVFDSDVYDKVAIRNVIASKVSDGSTSFENVEKQIKEIAKNKK